MSPKSSLARGLRVASSFLWISVATLIFLQAGVIVVGIFLTPEDVAIYSAAAATAGFVNLPVYATVALGAPKFAALHAQHCRPELQALFTTIVRWTLGPSVAIALVFGIFGAMVLRLFGPGFEQGYPALMILTLGMLSGAFVGPVAHLLTMTGHQAITARVQITCAALAVVLGLAFTPLWGIVGTALGFAAASPRPPPSAATHPSPTRPTSWGNTTSEPFGWPSWCRGGISPSHRVCGDALGADRPGWLVHIQNERAASSYWPDDAEVSEELDEPVRSALRAMVGYAPAKWSGVDSSQAPLQVV